MDLQPYISTVITALKCIVIFDAVSWLKCIVIYDVMPLDG